MIRFYFKHYSTVGRNREKLGSGCKTQFSNTCECSILPHQYIRIFPLDFSDCLILKILENWVLLIYPILIYRTLDITYYKGVWNVRRRK